MLEQQRMLARLLRELADAVAALTDEELTECLLGRLHLSLSKRTVRARTKPKGRTDQHSVPAQEVAARLQGLSDRESGRQLLDDLCKTKSSLEQLARVLDLPVQREDTVETLRDKVVEATIGFRLRSEAIRGKPPSPT